MSAERRPNDLNAKAQKLLDDTATKGIEEAIIRGLAEEGWHVRKDDLVVQRRRDGRFAVGLIVEEHA